jgi:hypothetical protein
VPKNEVGIEGLPIRNCDANEGNIFDASMLPDAEFMPKFESLIIGAVGEGWTTLLWLYSVAGELELIVAC